MKKQLFALGLATIALFIWNAISWMALPFHGQMLRSLPEPAFQAIKKDGLIPQNGIYHYPGLDDPEMIQKVEAGPRIPFMVFVSEGTAAFDPIDFVKSFFFNFISAGLLLFLLSKLADHSMINILSVSIVIALLVGFMSDLPQTSWFKFPLAFAIINMVDHIVAFILAGWLLRKFALQERELVP